jgi:aerobic carbon-monoxide dehydrogenase large subunit
LTTAIREVNDFPHGSRDDAQKGEGLTEIERDLPARLIGARTTRKEDPRLLTGQGSYVDDVPLPGIGHVVYVRSPYPSARIESIDVTLAKEAPGVYAVLTGEELNVDIELLPIWNGSILPITDVSYVGEPIVMVVASSRAKAEDAAELVEVGYTPRPHVVDLEEAIRDTALVHPGDETNVFGRSETIDPDVDVILATAPYVFTETLQQHRYVHSPMETRGVLARWQSGPRRMTVWMSTQGPHPAAAHFSRMLRLPQSSVHVVAADVGGAFGQKIAVTREESAVAVAARLLGRPVKWIEDRNENLIAGPHARREMANVSVATDQDGTILAIKVDHYQDCGAFGGAGIRLFEQMMPGPYRIPHLAIRSAAVHTNTSSRAAYRGPWMMESVIREVMVDIVARGLSIDPIDVRRRNLIHQSDLPHQTVTGHTYDVLTADQALERVIAILDYQSFREEQTQARAEGRYLGVGISLFVEPTAMNGHMQSEGIAVRIDASGQVFVSAGSGSQGHSLETTICQIVADQLGIDFTEVNIVLGDTDATPLGGLTAGSRSAVGGGNSAMRAAIDLRAKVLQIAAHELEASVDDLEIAHGVVSVRGTPQASRTFAQIAATAASSINLPDGMSPGLETIGRFTTPTSQPTFSNAAHAAVCEVDIETGMVALKRFIVSEDCGVIINPNVVEGQIAGGVAQGIGGVLYEHFVYDSSGNPITSTYLDYLIPTSAEIPMLEYDHIETRATTNPGGFKGMGEGGAIGAPAAVINAVADALSPFGVKVTSQPLTPPIILELLAQTPG